MKPRILALYLALAGLVLSSTIITIYAYNSKTGVPKTTKQNNEAIFNWGSSS